MRVESVYTPGMPSAEKRAEYDEVERLVEAELPEIMARDTGALWGDAFALRLVRHELRKAREAKGLTLDAAAAHVGVTADDLVRLEAGRGDASVFTLGRVAAGYGYKLRLSVEPAVASPPPPEAAVPRLADAGHGRTAAEVQPAARDLG